MAQYPIEAVYCDPSQPASIEELRREGIPCQPAKNDILTGRDLHYEMIKSRRFKLFKDQNPQPEDELSMYHWPEPQDLLPDQDAKAEKPVDQYNHTMDCDRYITIMTYRSNKKKRPHVIGEIKSRSEGEKPIDIERRIRKNRTRVIQTESWS